MPMPRIAPIVAAAVLASVLSFSHYSSTRVSGAEAAQTGDGIVRIRSAYSVDETVARIKADIAAKGIMLFQVIDQARLAADAGIKLNRSTLVVFGNPPLGTQFITANPNAGLDWPVRLLVTESDNGDVHAVYTDFDWIARRHRITSRDGQFKMATQVVGSITSSVSKSQ